MNIAALRAVPRRAWWTLTVLTLIVFAFAFDRDLGVTVVAVALALRLLADQLKPSEVTWRAADSSRDQYRARYRSAPLRRRRARFFNDDELTLGVSDDGGWINPATGSFMNEHSGLDNSGCFYGQSNHSGMDHRW
jgi:hypothetical protein